MKVEELPYRVLLVEDDPVSAQTTKLLLERRGINIDVCRSGAEALESVQSPSRQYALAILDFRLPDGTAEDLLQRIKELCPTLNILVYSGDPSRSAVTTSWQHGAVGFVEKGDDGSLLVETVLNWCAKYEDTHCVVMGRERGSPELITKMGMIGFSAALEEIGKRVERYRRLNQNVLILGETGTGKELVARALRRNDTLPYLAVNCASYQGDASLLESELFGHVKGAFSGAVTEKKGIFEAAEGGIVFLDEVHHLSSAAQARLLRAIQEKRIRKLGSNSEIDVSFRLIVSAKPELRAHAEAGRFLLDLFHRISALTLYIPPLRERPEDIEPLVAHFCEKYNRETGERKQILLKTLRYLEDYVWFGNVRELENTIVQILADSGSDRIGPEQLDPKFFGSRADNRHSTFSAFKTSQLKAEREFLMAVLRTSQSKSDAARKLKVPPTTLHSLLVRHQVEAR